MYTIWSQTRAQQQKQRQEMIKYFEAEKHIAQWSLGYRWNKEGNKKVPGV
jgi:hypothetical protein